MLQKCLLILALAGISACSKSKDSESSSAPSPSPSSLQAPNWPAYQNSTLSGQVFGKEWKVMSALARTSIHNPEEKTIEFYSEQMPDACKKKAFSAKPYATVVIPKNYVTGESFADMASGSMTGNPLVFIHLEQTSKNIMAEKTKIQITEVKSDGFMVKVYAQAIESNGTISEINGQTYVLDCEKSVDFSVWEDLAGWYDLKTFDGVSKKPRTAVIEVDDHHLFYDRASQRYVSTVVFPLFSSVSENSAVSFNFGPMQGLGSTIVQRQNGFQVLKYSYHGPLTYEGMDITLNLDLQATRKNQELHVQYTLEIPGHVKAESHSFVLAE